MKEGVIIRYVRNGQKCVPGRQRMVWGEHVAIDDANEDFPW